jgi:hemerythrin
MSNQAFKQIVWNEQWELGVTLLDSQHKKLVSVINELAMVRMNLIFTTHPSQVVKLKHQRWMIGAALDELIAYTEYHFSAEEELMKQYGYKESKQHKAAHANFTKRIVEFRERYVRYEILDLGEDLLHFLRDWLFNHILRSDKEMCRKIGLIKNSEPSVESITRRTWNQFKLPKIRRNKIFPLDEVSKKKHDRSFSVFCCTSQM